MSGTVKGRRHSPAVYRRRRLVVVLALLAIVAIVWLLVAQPWRGSATGAGPTPSTAQTQGPASDLPVPSATEVGEQETTPPDDGSDAAATPSTTPTAPPCLAGALQVVPLTDLEAYGSGQNPQLSIRLTNTGSTDCTLNVGTSSQVFTITSGDDTWWRSTDCQSEPSDMVVLLAAGQTVSSATPLTWDRTRSAVGTCTDPARPLAPGGGSSYHLSVEIGGATSTESAQFLLY